MNNISLVGRIANDLELKYTQNQNAVLSFTIAVPRPHVKDTTDFIRCVAWRNAAEFINKFFHKGKMIAVTGVLTSRSWKDEAGNTKSVNEVIVDSVEFCGDKKAEETQPAETGGFIPMDADDGLPFV